jgi:hypothetical protein
MCYRSGSKKLRSHRAGDPGGLFRPVGTVDVIEGNGSSVAEIVDAPVNGKQLAYTSDTN